MAQITRPTKAASSTESYAANSVLTSAELDGDMEILKDGHNDHDTGTSKWQVVSAQNTSSTPLISNNSTGTNDIVDLRDNGTTVFKVADGGAATFSPGGTTKVVANSSGLTLSNSATVAMGSAKITGLAAATASGDALRYEQVLGALTGYRRPILNWLSTTTVAVENNTGTEHQTTIIFPDGEVRSVTENTGSTTKYRLFDITATAEFTSGTEDSGVRSGISEANNTWYAIYAVKSLINSANFVLAGDTTFPSQANFATLNSRYGTNSWIYLGMVRNGDNAGTAGDLLNFIHNGSDTTFRNTIASGAAQLNMTGILLATGAGTSRTYTYAAGSGAAQIPSHLDLVYYAGAAGSGSGQTTFTDSAGNITFAEFGGDARVSYITPLVNAAGGYKIANASSVNMDIYLIGFKDRLLGIGFNPVL